ncbi:acyltransferase family protein [Ornithinibacter aureus]|uniref:Acyltransferase family protein n=1 Tax=Ornithinibacter aureus TaxID=622664 RepID=A0ABP8JCV8_9MICO|nr:acyltransferase family protein [Ornithinibacter aureus]KAF0832649.1 peptidoglycan/LPS O-acetylase OafA/YrhL [Ornithinibacter aureus]
MTARPDAPAPPLTRGPAGRGAHLGYRPALDGLRAVAVIVVMLYHGGVSCAAGGFLGVDVFFVLSGFLITSLLVKEWRRTGRIDVIAFWVRRARRLLPAVLVVVFAVAVYGFVAPQPQSRLLGDALSTLGYVSNWWFMISGQSYFAQFVEPSALRHTWSLAIEEQFYILFPLLLVAMLGRLRLRAGAVRTVLLAGAIGSAALMAFLHDPLADPSRAYYGTDTRAQALLLGAALALSPSLLAPARPLYSRIGGRLVRLPTRSMVGVLALGGVLVLVATARELAPWMYRGGFFLAAVLSAVVIASVTAAPRSALARGLSWAPMVAVGVLSYGLYLWHWPVFVVLNHERTGLDGAALLAVRFAVTGLLAYLSFVFVEEPIRTQRLQARFTRTQWRRAVGATLAAVVAATVVASASAPQGAGEAEQASGRPNPVPDAQGRLVTAFLLGDSQAFRLRDHYANQVDGLAVTGSTQLGCGTLLPERETDGQTVPNIPACAEWEPRWTQEVAREQPDVVVVMLGLGELYDRRVDGEVLTFGTPEYRAWLNRELDRRRELVAPHARHFSVATVVCMQISADAANQTTRIANDSQRLSWLNDVIRAYAAERPGVGVVDLFSTVCADGFTNEIDGVTLRDDGLHLNAPGADLVWRRVGPSIVDAAG